MPSDQADIQIDKWYVISKWIHMTGACIFPCAKRVQTHKNCLKWIVIQHLPKGIGYSGGVNAINRTKLPKTKRTHVVHYPIHRWRHSLPWLSWFKTSHERLEDQAKEWCPRVLISKLKSHFTFHWSSKAFGNAETSKCPPWSCHKQERRPPGVADSQDYTAN